MTQGPPPAGVVTPEELADVSGIPVETIRYHCRQGNIPGARQAGRAWLIPTPEADSWAAGYTRYGSLRKHEGQAPPRGLALNDPPTRRQRPDEKGSP